MEKIIIFSVIGIIVIIVIAILINQYNKFQYQLIKLNKGEVNLNNLFEKKYHILLRYFDIMNKNGNIDEKEFEPYKLLNTKISIYKFNDAMEKMDNILNKYLDNNEKLTKNEAFINIRNELINTNNAINGCKKYYNNNLVNYNNLCHKFPSNILAKLLHYKEIDFIEEEQADSFKILDE